MLQCVVVRCSALRCIAVCCNASQYVAVRCSALQCVAVRCSALQCVAVQCSALQCVVCVLNVSQIRHSQDVGFDFRVTYVRAPGCAEQKKAEKKKAYQPEKSRLICERAQNVNSQISQHSD